MVLLSRRFCWPAILRLPCERPYNPAEETSAVWAVSLSLAATHEIDFSFFSNGYLDVSVHHVSHPPLWIHDGHIRVPRDHRLFVNSPGHFADFHALHRLRIPRHPPYALSSLATFIQSSRHEPMLLPFPGRPAKVGLGVTFSNNLRTF